MLKPIVNDWANTMDPPLDADNNIQVLTPNLLRCPQTIP